MIPLNGITLWKAENSFSDYFSLLHCFYPSIRVFCEKQNIDNHLQPLYGHHVLNDHKGNPYLIP